MRVLPFIPLLLALPLAAPAQPGAPRGVDFRRDVLPVLSAKCFHCHGPDEHSREAKLRLDVREDALKDRDGFRAIVPGDTKSSEAMARILSKDSEDVMPPPKQDKPLTAAEAEIIRQWIAQGADYEQHWAFEKPKLPAVPAAPAGAKILNPIDAFIAAKLTEKGLTQAPEADRFTLLRRVALDLVGLPPTPEEYAAYAKDTAPGAYARAVERLLAAPQYGEKWARMWLDLARYADSTGYGSDRFRLNIWPYRDWVINAFNRNLPYDQFTLEQLAGDLLPKPTAEQMVATAFHRNTMTQTEGGTNDEEYRVAAVKDRVATTMQVWMGLTAGCAQCHSHKFDPISQKEYYQLFAVFNQSEDADRDDESPRLPVPNEMDSGRKGALSKELAALEKKLADDPKIAAEQRAWEDRMARPIDWQSLKASEVKASTATATTAIIQPDGTIARQGSTREKETLTLRYPGPMKGLTALRLEALPDESPSKPDPAQPAKGSGMVSEISLRLASAKPSAAANGRYVRIEQAPGKYLHVAEVEVTSGGRNAARQGKASQSSTGFGGDAARAIDGVTDGDFEKNSVTHVDSKDRNPWWEVDLGKEAPIDKVVVWNRTDSDFEDRLQGASLLVLDAQRRPLFKTPISPVPKPKAEFAPGGGAPVTLVNTSADSAARGSQPVAAIDGKLATGWTPDGTPESVHAWTAEFSQPLEVPEGWALTVEVAQTLGKFRLSTTTEPTPVRELPAEIRSALALEPTERSPEQRAALTNYFRPLSREGAELNKQIEAKKQEIARLKPLELPIMRELAKDKRRETHLLTKGNFLLPGDKVTAALPVSFGPAPSGETDRLGLAHWIISADNPLTARVAVNRFWAQIFGTGLTETEEDFGTQGQYPTHPELLDWLAVTFQKPKAEGGLGWDIKALLRLIVTSQTYQQSSLATEAAREKDARNVWLSHYSRRRLEAEAIRDQALALSGLLSRKIGGPSVYPPQPAGLWRVAFNGDQNNYPTSKGEDRRRRGIYTFWRRTAPNPTMATLDAPSRETCTIRRVPTNTPLQAFVTLNDPVFFECAQALAQRIATQPGDANARIRWALEAVLARPATEPQMAALRELYGAELKNYRQRADDAKKLTTNADLPPSTVSDPAELAAWTVLANVLLNLDGVMTKS